MTTAITEHLQRIYEVAGELTPTLVVDTARPEDHPLHSHFEWDDNIAGEKYRRVQAAGLIRSCIVITEEPDGAPRRIRTYHSVNRVDGPSYMPVTEIVQDPFLRQLMLKAAEREWKALQRKYSHLAEFVDLIRSDIESATAAA